MFSTQELTHIFDSFHQKTVLIIGDVMLDHYLFGKVSRLSPEAPVPIVALDRHSTMLGGASNVALNIKALGATPILCSVIGDDDRGKSLIRLVEEKSMITDGLYSSTERKTTIKSRVIGNSVQLVRIDEEDTHPLTALEEEHFLAIIHQIM
ncbi:MAG: PfkB family carbohydrate kinase, partial [Bacteroidales bacterium]|nr:PfkB family carbohydrate kinase [Bacteroidales bacterium]